MHAGPVITRSRNFKLTGRVRMRDAIERTGMLRGQRIVALEVEEQFERTNYTNYSAPRTNENDYLWVRYTHWRAATALDMADPALRWLIDGPGSTAGKPGQSSPTTMG